MDINVKDGIIIAKPTKFVRGKYNLKDLVTRIPKDSHAEEVDWGGPFGKEAW